MKFISTTYLLLQHAENQITMLSQTSSLGSKQGWTGLKVCVLWFFMYYPCGRLGVRRLWCRCLCGQLKQGGGDSSKPLRGHLWNRLTNASLLCHKDTRLTKMPINAPLYNTFICHPGIYPCSVLNCITMADKTRSHFQAVLQGDQSMRSCPGRFLLNFDGLSVLLLADNYLFSRETTLVS